MASQKVLKKLSKEGFFFGTLEENSLGSSASEVIRALLNSGKAYRFKFELEDNEKDSLAVSFFKLSSKKKIKNSVGEKLGNANFVFTMSRIVEFFNKFNLDGKDFVEDKLVLYEVECKDGESLIYIISEELYDRILDIEYAETEEVSEAEYRKECDEENIDDAIDYDEENNQEAF